MNVKVNIIHYFPKLPRTAVQASILLIFCLFSLKLTAVPLTFIDQSIIDSLADDAILAFTSISDPGSGMTTENAIVHAKEIIDRLRKIARQDANGKYILWKAKEIEEQVFLEESGLLLEKNQWKQKQSIELISQFNNKFADPRPSFGELFGFQAQLADLDSVKAIEMKRSILRQASKLSLGLPLIIEDLILRNMSDSAHAEITYCENNLQWLGIPSTKIASLEAKLLARSSIEDEKVSLNKDLFRLDTLLKKNNISESKTVSSIIQYRLEKLKGMMITLEWEQFNREFHRLDGKIGYKEDSLASKAITLLRSLGPASAGEYLDTMKTAGISSEKIARVDRLILETIIAQKKDDTPKSDFYLINEDTSDNKPVFADLLIEARKRSLAKKDSLNELKKENAKLTQIEEVKKLRLKVAYEEQVKRIEAKCELERQEAKEQLLAIYTLIESKKFNEAENIFTKSNEILKGYLSEKEFRELSEKLTSTESHQ